MAELLTVSTAYAASADFTLTDGQTATVLLKNGVGQLPAGVTSNIQVKTSEGVYMTLDQLTAGAPMLTISGAGTYRVVKPAGPSLGVDKN